MKISYNWLKEYLCQGTEATELSAQEAAEILTTIGLEIEGIEKIESIRGGLEGLVVAHVVECTEHPDSDHLHITRVDVGSDELLQVVCGAPNVAKGQKVVLATVGTTLYPEGEAEGFKIKKSKIRGVESLGMLCAEDEIGVGNSHDGIIVLDDKWAVGTPAAEVFDMQGDYTMEVGLTPNRIDAGSHYGVARDLAAYLSANGADARATLADTGAFRVANNSRPIKVIVEDAAAAPRYMGVVMTGIKVGPSPEWLQTRLRAIGMNPKNNIVDITNYVMHECGQPLHAFDLAKVKGDEIRVRKCTEGTLFTTLDGVERKLSAEDLMICNATDPMCLAGVFGGMDSGVSDSTTEIFIESAYFNPVSVRKSAKRHGLNTDSSFRYERGTDPNMPPYALQRAALLVSELAGGSISSEVVDNYPTPVAPFSFEVRYANINNLIGKQIEPPKVKAILNGLEIRIENENTEGFTAIVPAYRVDVQREVDLIEDILRIYGFNNIENPHYIKNVITHGNQATTDRLVNTLSNMLVSMGATEIMSNSLTKASYYENLSSCPTENCVRILNPLSQELNVMRQSLLFNALEAIELNVNHKRGDLKLFEVGNCYFYNPAKAAEADAGLRPYREEQRLAMAVTGRAAQPSWNVKSAPSNLFTLKVMIERALQRVGININEGRYESSTSDLYSDAVVYTLRGKRLFEMGVVSPKMRAMFGLKSEVYFMELNLEQLAKVAATVRVSAVEISKFPEVSRDLALLVDSSVTFSTLREAAAKAERKLLKSVSLFDVYQGDKLPAGKKSYALNFVLQDSTKTLTDTEIERSMATIASALEKAVGAQIRTA